MQLFYAPQIPASGGFILSPDESRHCIRVLRKRKGDIIEAVDGRGIFCRAEIINDADTACEVRIIHLTENYNLRSFKLSIAIAITKNADRFEWFAEKAAETGIDEIFPMITEKTERRKVNEQRLGKILISAMKQSGRAFLPAAKHTLKFSEIIAMPFNGQKFIAVCNHESGAIKHLKEIYRKGENALVMIGPEGDFTQAEVSAAISKGFIPASLGKARLRVETAALAACIGLNWMNE